MREIISDKNLGFVKVIQNWDITATSPTQSDYPPHFYSINDQYAISLVSLEGIGSLKTFTYSATGSLDTRFLATQYRLSRDGNRWTNFMDLNSNIDNGPALDPKSDLWIDLRWTRSGTSTTGDIRLLGFELDAEIDRGEIDGDSQFILGTGSSQIVKPPYVYKVFKITDMEVLGTWSSVDIKYRFSQDNSRTWTQWEPFTKENITTVRINPIRFFQIEYLVTNNGSSKTSIYDINLIGDFQNVTQGSRGQNLYGIRECCKSNILSGTLDSSGNLVPFGGSTNMLNGQACPDNVFKPLTDDQKAALFNPYQQASATNLLNKLSNDAQSITGLKVQYFATDPDRKGIDYTIHEYQLLNIVCEGELKVSVEGNNFPDNQIVMNQFDLNLFETMEVHITKDQFKTVFGEQRRPSKMDFLYLCDISRMFQVEHAQQFRQFNNNSIYYKLILKKYNQSANIIAATPEIETSVNTLTKNTTIDELFGVENILDKKSTANKPQTRTTTREPIRLEYNARVNKELIENSTTIISKSNYDMSSVDFGTTAVMYKNMNQKLLVSDNLSFNCWFSIYNYVQDDVFNFYSNYDESTKSGIKINLINDNVYLHLNTDTYTFSFTGATNSTQDLEENTWYALLINIDQRQGLLSQYIYKRDVSNELQAAMINTTILQQLYTATQSIGLHEFELEDGMYPSILGSDMKLTNIRLFTDVIPEDYQSKLLNTYLLGTETKTLIFSDNANQHLSLQYFPLMGDDQ